MSPIINDMARGCGRAALIRSIAAGIVLSLGCVFIFLPLALVTTFDASPWVLVATSGLFLLLIFGGGVAYIVIVLRRRKANLDTAFVPLGLTGSAYSTVFRQYHGTIGGRQVDVWLNRGPILEIEISTPLQTRLGVTGLHADTRFLSGLFGKQPLVFDDPSLDDLITFALDADWTRALLADRRAIDVLRRLTATEAQFTRQQVLLRPGAFKLMLSGNKHLLNFEITPEQTTQWLDDLQALAGIAERAPAPQITDTPSSAEEFAQKLRQRTPYLALWVGLATLVSILLCGGLIAALVLLLAGE